MASQRGVEHFDGVCEGDMASGAAKGGGDLHEAAGRDQEAGGSIGNMDNDPPSARFEAFARPTEDMLELQTATKFSLRGQWYADLLALQRAFGHAGSTRVPPPPAFG